MRCMSDDSLQKSINLVKHEPLSGATLYKKEVKTTPGAPWNSPSASISAVGHRSTRLQAN